jgi:hypothetical protein
LNFIAESIVKRYKKQDDFDTFVEELLKFYSIVATDYHNFITNELDEEIFNELMMEFYNTERCHIPQAPFFGNATMDDMIKLYDLFDIEKIKVVGVQTPLVVANKYFFKLKHLSEKKFSARSTGMTSLLNVPYRTNEKYKKGNAAYNTNPVKLGKLSA